ncbi:precorrin-6Y C5,15-methyltransferase (decarboxylating) [Desulfuromusa kysingii]|uniref:Precorrin-6Y C5,15-methyltransferase (Decarboxylating) n=1 Tax=Desulfuromusa kysingii TaxID=37625 RepID=A0A1H4CIP1_9BACT|nr:precorrin-6y C5,15-methyltransferase (decarboxylating) subunit CbiE [Desulfuromusa kysingii]SEA60193.1 precorrin-6Y C5,15-methyltransferase (decarboxylating) [Desulfuromusa kysingii]
MKSIHVIGAGIAGHEGFTPQALELINHSELLFGAERLLGLFPDFPGETVTIDDHNLSEMVSRLHNCEKRVVVLASGDPLFFGLGRYLLRNLADELIEFLPNVTSVQYAFAKIREPWDDSIFISVHGRALKDVVDRIVSNDKAAILTDATNTPEMIAQELMNRRRSGYKAYLCENLGTPIEKIRVTNVKGLQELDVAPLNVLILIREYEDEIQGHIPTFGIPDEEFVSIKQLITKEEVRVVTLAKLKLRHDMCLWDIGAGSGSICVEADHLLSHGRIFAIERNSEYRQFIKENLLKFNTRNVMLIEGDAPDCLEELPDPDRVFIGGSGGRLWEILDTVDQRLAVGGRIVLNASTLDTLTSANEYFGNAGYEVEVVTVNIARTCPHSNYKLFEAYDPVYILTAVK